MSKTALVFGGGGAKGAYQIGAVKALNKLKIKYDIITGCSVGSINGAIVAQGDFDLAMKLWKTLSTDKILDLKENETGINVKGAFENSGYDYTNLKNLLIKYIDEDKLRKSPVDYGLVTVKYPEMTPLYIFKEDMEIGKIVDYILGSSAFFPAMKPHKIGENMYIDGGFSDNLPINMAIEKGADKIIAIDLKAVGMIKKPKSKDVKITKISSYYDLGKILDFNKDQAKKNMKLGYNDTLKTFGKLDGFKFTFEKGDILKHSKKIAPKIEELFKKMFANNKHLKKVFIKGINLLYYTETKREGKPCTKDMATFNLECLMESLKLPYFQTYKLKKAHFLINKELKEYDISDLSSLKELLVNFNLSGNIMDILKKLKQATDSFDKVKFIKFLSENIDFLLEKNPKLLTFLGICAPKEFLCAVYLKFL